MSGQFQLAAGGQMLLAAHTQSTGLDNSSTTSTLTLQSSTAATEEGLRDAVQRIAGALDR